MRILRKLMSMLEERRMWKDYIVSGRVAEYIGELIGARPYYMTFDEYKNSRNSRKEIEECWVTFRL